MMINPDVVFFDLDHTLIDTDCEWAWKNMLVDMGMVPESQRAQQEEYIDLHADGKTPAEEYLDFLTSDFVGKSVEEMAYLAERNFETNIRHKIFPKAVEIIESILSVGGKPILLSGSFRPILGPVAAHLGFEEIVCTELEVIEGQFTGQLESEFCIREGKLNRALDYCTQHNHQLQEAGFFGDSLSDVQMFEQVSQATAINPRPNLADLANKNGWCIMHWDCSS